MKRAALPLLTPRDVRNDGRDHVRLSSRAPSPVAPGRTSGTGPRSWSARARVACPSVVPRASAPDCYCDTDVCQTFSYSYGDCAARGPSIPSAVPTAVPTSVPVSWSVSIYACPASGAAPMTFSTYCTADDPSSCAATESKSIGCYWESDEIYDGTSLSVSRVNNLCLDGDVWAMSFNYTAAHGACEAAVAGLLGGALSKANLTNGDLDGLLCVRPADDDDNPPARSSFLLLWWFSSSSFHELPPSRERAR